MLTRRDVEILTILTRKVRVLSIAQIARTWWGQALHPIQAARARLQILESRGQVRCASFSVHPEFVLETPLTIWRPGNLQPDFGALSYRAHARWVHRPVFETLVFATKMTAAYLGGSGGSPPDANHATHDMHVGAVYLLKRLYEPLSADSWQSEQAILASRSGCDDKLPDAIVTHPETMAVDFVGKYTKAKLAAFHEYCAREKMGYELW